MQIDLVQIDASADVVASSRQALVRLADAIGILQREHDQLIPLVVEGPPSLRPLRMRQLKSIAKHLAAARAEEARISKWVGGNSLSRRALVSIRCGATFPRCATCDCSTLAIGTAV